MSEGAFLFSFVYGMYVNIVSYLYGKQIKPKLGNKLYLRMIFICVYLNLCYLCECRTMILKFISNRSNDDLSFFSIMIYLKIPMSSVQLPSNKLYIKAEPAVNHYFFNNVRLFVHVCTG